MPDVQLFIPVVQRRLVRLPSNLIPLVESSFMIETHMTFEERIMLLQFALRLPEKFLQL